MLLFKETFMKKRIKIKYFKTKTINNNNFNAIKNDYKKTVKIK